MIEIWKDIERLNGTHQISNLGRIRSVDRWVKCRGLTFRKGQIIKLSKSRFGYLFSNIKSNGIGYNIVVHREVAKVFIPKIEGKNYVNHINGNKENNSVENLEWCTMAENNQHAYDTGLKLGPIGEKQWASKLKTNEVINIFKMAHSGKYSDSEIAEKYGVRRTAVNRIKNGKRWHHFTKNIAV